jgi:hypothetical protein
MDRNQEVRLVRALHILTPLAEQTTASLAREKVGDTGDLVADLRRFPPLLYQNGEDGSRVDVTADLMPVRDYWTTAREWLAEFTRQTGLQDTLAIEGYGFWWTLNGQKFVAGLTELGNVFAWIDLMEAVRQHTRFERVLIHGRHGTISHLAYQVFKGPEIYIQPGPTSEQAREGRTPRLLGLMVVRLLLGMAYLVYSLFRRPDICLFSNTNLLRQTATHSKEHLYDVYLGDVARALATKGWKVAVIEKYGPNASWAGLIARRFFFASDIIFLLSTPSLGKIGFHRRVRRKWREKWSTVQPSLATHMHCRGYDLSPLLLPLIRNEFLVHAADLEVMTGIWRQILTLWRPRILYVNNSYGRAAFTAIVAAKLLGIPTIEQQHGVIGKNHLAYLQPEHLGSRTRRPLCDAMVVWGEHTRRFLASEGTYKPEQMVICGFPRIDAMLEKRPSGSLARKQLGIPPGVPVILYTSNGFARDLIPDILDSVRRVPTSTNPHWLVKLHPREETRHLWEAAINQRKLLTVKVLEGSYDFYALLAACDLHASFASTTLIEAAIWGKPNLGLQFAHLSDPAGYAEANAFLPVSPVELGPAAISLLTDPAEKERLLALQKAFAEDWCVHDGHAVERIVNLIESTTERTAFPESVDHAAP